MAVDAVLGGVEDREARAPAPTVSGADRDAAVAHLRRAGIRGTLVYTDAACGLHALRLPDLAALAPPDGPDVGCRFELSAGGRVVAPRGAAWESSRMYALCRGRVVDVVVPPEARPRFSFDGCVPAWRPTTPPALTVVRGEELVEVGAACRGGPPCERIVVPRRLVRTAAASHPSVPTDLGAIRRIRIDDVAWLSPARVVLLLRLRIDGIVAEQQLVAVLEGGRLRGSYYFFDADRDGLEASPHGGRVWVGRAFAFTSAGPRLPVPDAFGPIRAATWSPDERWLALAARNAIAFVRPGRGAEAQVVSVPLDAADLAWR